MNVGPDAAASALSTTWEHLVGGIPDGWFQREEGMFAAVTGVEVPTLNGVWSERVDFDEVMASKLLDRVAASGRPYCLELRPGASPQMVRVAVERGMVGPEQVPMMVLEDADRLGAAPRPAGLTIRQLEPAEALIHAETAAAGFEVPVEPFVALMTPASLSRPGVRCYVGEVDGVAVTTGMGVTLGDWVGVFNIATPPEFRGRGYGAAVTARVAADGLADGARWSYLQSSPSGYDVYLRLGYQTLERWDCWVTAP